MSSKALAAVWDEVQGACDLARIQQVLTATGNIDNADLVLDGWSPLHFLCENRSLKNATRAQGIALLVRAGVDGSVVDENGWSALHVLCKNRSSASEYGTDLSASLRELLAAKGLQVNAQTTDSHKTALHLLCENDACSAACLSTLLSARTNVNSVDADGNTALHYASESAAVDAPTLELLLGANAQPNVQNHFHATPFYCLCENTAVTAAAIAAMLKHSADPTIANNIGNSPLHALCENPSVSVPMLEAIVASKRANLTMTNSLGKTAFECLSSAKADCVAYLQQFAAPTLGATANTAASDATAVGGEDPSELPAPLQRALEAWNASLPPCDRAFYHAVCCESALAASYDAVQDSSALLSDDPENTALFRAWEASLAAWRASIVLAFAALIPPHSWDQLASKHRRPVPSDLQAVATNVQTIWTQFPDQSQRRDRFERLATIFKNT